MAIGRIGSRDSATVIETYRYVASGGETSLSGSDAGGATLNYPLNYEVVFLNGVRLVRGDDYQATTGTSITGLSALNAGDVVEILVFQAVDVANAVTSTYVNSTFVPNSLVTAKGQIIAASGSATPAAVPAGSTNGHILTWDTAEATSMKWAAAPASGIPATLLDAKGDLIVASAADTAARLAVGTNGHALLADSGATNGVKWGAVGKILQVVNTVKTNSFTTTSTSYVDVTDFSASITCSSTANKVLVVVAIPNLGMSDSNIGSLNLLRGATTLTSNTDGGAADTNDAWVVFGGGGMETGSDNRKVGSGIIAYLDSPSSTSALTYKCQMRVSGGTGYFNRWGNNTDVASVATIILMEVAG